MDSTIPQAILEDLILLDQPSNTEKGVKKLKQPLSNRLTTPFSEPFRPQTEDSGDQYPYSKFTNDKSVIRNLSSALRDNTIDKKANNEKLSSSNDALLKLDDQSSESGPKHHVNRKEVALMKHAMLDLLKQLDDTRIKNINQSSIGGEATTKDMDALLETITQEQKIYDTVFQEMIRQVMAHMLERGEILMEIRSRYSKMFNKVPKHVKRIYTQAIAHRKLVVRLLAELDQVREKLMHLIKDIGDVRNHDLHMANLSRDLTDIMSSFSVSDEILSEYQELSKMQRSRLEIQLNEISKDREAWLDMSTMLLLKVAREHELTEIVELHKAELYRINYVRSVLFQIKATNEKEILSIMRQVTVWRESILKLAAKARQQDLSDLEHINSVINSAKQLFKCLRDKDTYIGALESENPLMTTLGSYDADHITNLLTYWLQNLSYITSRYIVDQDLPIREENLKVRESMENWIELARKTLYRCEHSVNGKEYHDRLEDLRNISVDIANWLENIDLRTTGENGTASALVAVQNNIENRLNYMVSRGKDRPLNYNELANLLEFIERWIKDLTNLAMVISKNDDDVHSKSVLRIDDLLLQIREQATNDICTRHEENNTLHSAMTKWLVDAITIDDSRDLESELATISQGLIFFNQNVLKDIGDLLLLSDDQRDLRHLLREMSQLWIDVGRSLLETHKKRRYASKNLEVANKEQHKEKNESFRSTADDERRVQTIELILEAELSQPYLKSWSL